jgi:hypothetical protein
VVRKISNADQRTASSSFCSWCIVT